MSVSGRGKVVIIDGKCTFELVVDGLVRIDFFLNNGVNIRCSSRRSMITGCITDDKYERL